MATISEKGPIVQEPMNGLVGDEKIGPSSRSSSNHHREDSLTQLDSHLVKIGGDIQEDPLGHLSPNEQEIIRRQLEMPEVKLSYFTLYRFATTNDLILIFTASLASIIAGAVLPLMTIVFGELAGVFQKFALGIMSPQEMQDELNRFTMYVPSVPLPWLPEFND